MTTEPGSRRRHDHRTRQQEGHGHRTRQQEGHGHRTRQQEGHGHRTRQQEGHGHRTLLWERAMPATPLQNRPSGGQAQRHPHRLRHVSVIALQQHLVAPEHEP